MSYVPVGRANLGKHVSHGLVYTVLIIELLIFLSIACKIPSDPILTLEFACFRELEWRIVFYWSLSLKCDPRVNCSSGEGLD